MAKARIIVALDHPDEARAVADWFARWRGHLTAVSENTGCGCCVDIWDVEGPGAALQELPEAVIAHPGVRPEDEGGPDLS